MNSPDKQSGNVLIIIFSIIGSLVILGILGFVVWTNFIDTRVNQATETKTQTTPKNTPVPVLKTASDETLGSGFSVSYPEGWTNVHTGADNPQSTTESQVDENILTSPSGGIRVILTVETNSQIGGLCDNEYLKLKYLATDTTPHFTDGRFAAYVVYFPNVKLYQYHIGLQKNTEAIRGVTLESNSACHFFYSEFFQRESSIEGIPDTFTILSIRFGDLGTGNNLKSGITEADVAAKLLGDEYEQAKVIVQSVRIE